MNLALLLRFVASIDYAVLLRFGSPWLSRFRQVSFSRQNEEVPLVGWNTCRLWDKLNDLHCSICSRPSRGVTSSGQRQEKAEASQDTFLQQMSNFVRKGMSKARAVHLQTQQGGPDYTVHSSDPGLWPLHSLLLNSSGFHMIAFEVKGC